MRALNQIAKSGGARRSAAPGRRRAAFTLAELLVVVTVILVLAALLLSATTRARTQGRQARCVSNLRQLGLACQMYWDENDSFAFRYRGAVTNGGDIWWFGWLAQWTGGNEGSRAFDPTFGALYPYLEARGVEICPALDYAMAQFKRKAIGAAYGYGYNRHLSGVNVNRVKAPAELIVLADAAQVNDFQAPASPANPMLEEFYYVSASAFEATAHFRHREQANAVFGDGHVARERPVAGSLDPRLPAHFVGRLRPEALRVP
jgi:prepilin-type processing-associated H-X9-DG protein/prepilin-type N-terminal cleavage/methylation domain-containing protein